ncbi:MAG: GNAT family protein [Paludibacter sp.]
MPFVDLTNTIAFTQNLIAGYLNSDRVNITCANTFVGLVGLKDTDLINNKTEIGYWLSESFQHKGIITRSCKSLMDYVFKIFGMNRVQLKAATENFKSQRVAERLGLSLEGIERDGELHDKGFVDLKIFALLKKNFISSN